MLKIYNTITRKKEEFKPIKKGQVGMYICGPTVYGPSHIGHASTYIAFDMIRRAFNYLGYKTKYVVNITDVHDDMIKEAKRQGITIFELADKNIAEYMKDLESLNILHADEYPRVTEHIKEIVETVQKIEEKGYAYKTSDGVYFRVSKFQDYGKLSGIRPEEGKTGTRVESDKYDKEGAVDFALWKFAKEDEDATWESPWGDGRPGWHIECSVMSRKYLGQPFDIHGGALDLRFPHHENEIAQSEAAYDKNLVNYWMHAGLLKVGGQKMSKSLGNFINIPDLLAKYDPMVVRYWRASSHYRSPVDWAEESVDAAKIALDRLRTMIGDWKCETGGKCGKVSEEYKKEFIKALEDDFNMPQALAVLWNVGKADNLAPADKLASILEFDKVFGLQLDQVGSDLSEKERKEIEELVKQRDQAREDKNWEESDNLREKLERMGVCVKDTDKGAIWSKIESK